MKVRYGFVTNSSSSSFVCIGISLDQIKDPDFVNVDNVWGDVKPKKSLYDNMKGTDLTIDGSEYNQYIGIPIWTFLTKYKDNKISEMKDIASKQLNKVLGLKLTSEQVEYHEEGWYDG